MAAAKLWIRKEEIMKKGILKRGLALGLAAVMTLGLGACGGGKNDNSQLAKENVYSFQEIAQISNEENVNDMIFQNDKLYLMTTKYDWDDEGNSNVTFGYYVSNVDGTDRSFVELSGPDRENNRSWINNTIFTKGGYIYAVENMAFEDASDPENYVYEDRYYLNCWDMEAKLLWSERIDNAKPDEYSYCNYMLDGGDGRVLAIMGGSKYEAVLYGPDGGEISRKELDQNFFERVNTIFTREDGTMMVISYDEDWTKCYLASYDLESGTMGEQTEFAFADNYSIRKGSTTDLLLTNNLGVYTWNIGDAEPKMIMNYINSDLPTNNMQYVQMVDDKHFVAVYNNIENWEQKCAYFTYVDPKDIPDKEVLVLGGEYVNSDVKSRVIEFNKTSDQYRITVKDYSTYNTNEDWTAGQTRLNSDITSGQMPDIMLLNDMSSYGNYISKGLLADIGEMLRADGELGQLEYLQNVWDAYSVNGKLYAVVPSFNVRTMIAKKSLVGDPQSWTMADVEAVIATMPEGAKVFGDMMRDTYIYYMLSYAGQIGRAHV